MKRKKARYRDIKDKCWVCKRVIYRSKCSHRGIAFHKGCYKRWPRKHILA